MFGHFIPDYMFRHYYEISPEFLRSLGIRSLILDLDNTLAPYEQPLPDERNLAWLGELKAAGIGAAFVSNNSSPDRVELFNREIGLPAYFKSGKPSTKNIKKALADMDCPPENAAVLGDQIFTDVWAGKRMGMTAIMVPPIKDKRTLFFRFKRLLEKPFVAKYRKIHGKDFQM